MLYNEYDLIFMFLLSCLRIIVNIVLIMLIGLVVKF